MNGPDHYRESERLLDLAVDPLGVGEFVPDALNLGLLAAAQVHATLALAAATALPGLPLTVTLNETIEEPDW